MTFRTSKHSSLHQSTGTWEQESKSSYIGDDDHIFVPNPSLRKRLPRTQLIPMDSGTRETKNWYVFGYLQSLKAWEVFQYIKVSFPPVGHTHEIIDQVLSRTSKRLRSNYAVTLYDLHSELNMCYLYDVRVVRIESLSNCTSLCEKERVLWNLRPFSHFGHFSLTSLRIDEFRNEGVFVTCKIKVNCKGDWKPLNFTGCTDHQKALKHLLHIDNTLP